MICIQLPFGKDSLPTAFSLASGRQNARLVPFATFAELSMSTTYCPHCRRVTNTRIVLEPPRRTPKGKELALRGSALYPLQWFHSQRGSAQRRREG